MKIRSKSSIRHLVRLQGKSKLTKKEKNTYYVRKFLLHFSLFQCTSHYTISEADLG